MAEDSKSAAGRLASPDDQLAETEDSQTDPLAKTKRAFWVLLCLLTLSIVAVAGIVTGWKLRTKDFQDVDPASAFTGRIVNFQVDLIAVDADGGTMTLDWFIINDTTCNSDNTASCTPVNIFFDTNLLRAYNGNTGSIGTSSNAQPTTPIFTWIPTANTSSTVRGNLPAFRTDMALLSIAPSQSTLQAYPFDVYIAEIFVFAQEVGTNATVGVAKETTDGVAVGFTAKVTHNPQLRSVNAVIDDSIVISRSGLVKAYVLVIVIGVWIVTLIFVISTVTSVICGYRQRVELLVIPVATMFTITSLRGTMPGAPTFGAVIDFVGLLPCLSLMIFSAAITIGFLVFADTAKHRRTFFDSFIEFHFSRKLLMHPGIQDADPHGGDP